MMRHQSTLVTALAALAVAPAVAGQEELAALEDALRGTVRSIEVMSGLERRLAEEPEVAVPLLLSTTEAPQLESPALDQRLLELRRQVSLLRMELDAVESPTAGGSPGSTGDTPGLRPSGPAPIALPSTTPQVSTGLSESMRGLMRRATRPGAEEPEPTSAPDAARDGRRAAVEPGAYTADPLGQAKASYHAGRYADGLVLLEGREDTQSLYWRARCLTRLERYDEAIELLTRVVEAAGDGYEGRRAATDLEFARWRRDFDQKLPEGLRRPEER